MSILFVGVQGSYQKFEIALFQDDVCLQTCIVDKVHASSQFLSFFQNLLKQNKKSFSDLSFLSVDQGPGAFTSLRVIIAIVNGLAFSSHISLIGVDGLDALAEQTFDLIKDQDVDYSNIIIVSLLNAYNNEVYYAIHRCEEKGMLDLVQSKGYKKIDLLLEELSGLSQNYKFIFTGNGSELHRDKITKIFSDRIQEPFAPLSTCSSMYVGKKGFSLWKKQEGLTSSLKPLYLKVQAFSVQK